MLIFISLMVFLVVLLVAFGVRNLRIEQTEKLYRLLGRGKQEEETLLSSKPEIVERLERVLLRAGVIMPAYRFLGYVAVSCGGFFTFGLLMTRSLPVSVFFSFAGLAMVWIMLKRQSNKRRESFENQMENVIAVLSSGLRAGASLAQSVVDLAEELDEPAATEFGLAGKEIEMGVPAAEALLGVAERLRSEDMQILATAAMVQSRSGGNLAEILDNLGDTVRDRKALRSSLKAYTAEGRLSGTVIGLIPFVVVGVLLVISPGYFTPMLSSPIGRIVLVGSFAMIIAGWFIIRQITQRLSY